MQGEDHAGGITDRHLMAASPLFRKAIDVRQAVLCRADVWAARMASGGDGANLENLLRLMWMDQGLSVTRFERSMFTVRAPGDPTRWSVGDKVDRLAPFDGMLPKYIDELRLSEAHCGVRAETVLSDKK